MPVMELYIESFRTKRLKVFLLEMSRLASACTGPKLQNHARCRGESAVSLAADAFGKANDCGVGRCYAFRPTSCNGLE